MKLEFTEFGGGPWKNIDISRNDLRMTIQRFTKTDAPYLMINMRPFDSIRLPDGRIWDRVGREYRHVKMHQKFIRLTKIQKEIVELLKSEDRKFLRQEIMNKVWGGFTAKINVNVSIYAIRKQVPGLVESSRGVAGYRLNRDIIKKYYFALPSDHGMGWTQCWT